MGTTWDTGYLPAYDHEGGPVVVLTDGQILRSHYREPDGAPVVGTVAGWRAGCDCGWTGTQLLRRDEYEYELGLSTGNVPLDGICPEAVEDLCGAEWATHLHQVLPLLAVHDAARHLAELTPAYDAARAALADAVHTAREQPGPTSWQKIADVVGITRQSAHERWA